MQCIVMQCSMFNAHCIAHCTLHMQYTLDILDSCVHVFMCPGAGVADLPHTGGVEIQPTFWQRRCWRPEDQQRRRERGRGLQREQLNAEQLLIEDRDVDLEEDELEFGNEEEELVDAGRERAAAGSPSRCQ